MLHVDLVQAFLGRVQADHVCLGAQHSIMSPNVVEMYGWAGLDFVIIGTEVEAIDKSMIESLLRAAHAARIVPLVKLAHPDPRLVAETLNYGANLLLVPHVTTGKQLQELVDAARFFPIGTRGECPVGRYTKYGLMPMDESRDLGNRVTSIIPIIEDKEAFDNIEEICANEHISMIEIGPFDFARSLGVEVRGPVVWKAVERITEVARGAGKKVMMPVWMTPQLTSWPAVIQHQIEHLIGRGITLLFQPDVHVLADHYRNLMPLRKIRVREEGETEAPAVRANDPVPADAFEQAQAQAKGTSKRKTKGTAKAAAASNGDVTAESGRDAKATPTAKAKGNAKAAAASNGDAAVERAGKATATPAVKAKGNAKAAAASNGDATVERAGKATATPAGKAKGNAKADATVERAGKATTTPAGKAKGNTKATASNGNGKPKASGATKAKQLSAAVGKAKQGTKPKANARASA